MQRAGLRDSFVLQRPSLMRRANAMQNEIWAQMEPARRRSWAQWTKKRDVVVHLESLPLRLASGLYTLASQPRLLPSQFGAAVYCIALQIKQKEATVDQIRPRARKKRAPHR